MINGPGPARPSLLRLMATGLYHTGVLRTLSVAAGYVQGAQAFQILTFHRVNDDHDPFFPALGIEVFERQMTYIAGAYRVLTVEELVDRMRRHALPRNALAITFDDGYRDTLSHAAPILARHGLPATIFLATGFIGTSEVPWFDRVAMAFKLTSVPAFEAPWGEILPLPDQAARLRALEAALARLKRSREPDFARDLERVLDSLGVSDPRCFKNLMLSWDDVHALAGLGFSLGAHTVTHPILSRVSASRARAEIHGSRAMIESACGGPPAAFAYPNGGSADYTETVKHLVREAGFTCAVTTRFGVNTRNTSPWELKRGGPWEAHLPTYALKLAWYRLSVS